MFQNYDIIILVSTFLDNSKIMQEYLKQAKYMTTSEKQTRVLGKKIAQQLKGGEILGLIGELGAGKTVLIKGMAKQLDIKKTITSPTFVLMKIYKVKNQKSKIKNFVHIDAYRLDSGQDLIDIGLDDWLGKSDTTTVIEWADKVKNILPKNTIIVTIKVGKKKNERIIEINGKSIRT